MRRCEHVRLQKSELQIIATVQRQFNNLLLIDHIAHCGAFGRYERCSGTDLHLFRDSTHLERNIEASLLIRLQHNPGTDDLIKAGVFGCQRVLAGSKLRNRIFPIVVNDHASAFIGADIGDCNLRTGNHRSRVIRDPPDDSGADSLRR